MVAPLAGAWIEISQSWILVFVNVVAPLAGAWIEIRTSDKRRTIFICRSPRGSVD